MQLADREELAADELSAFEDSFEYEDHRLFEEGSYAEIARRFKNRARHKLWLGVLVSVAFAVLAALTFIDYGGDGDTFGLFVGAGYAAIALSTLLYWTRSSVRMSTTAERVLTLLEEDETAANAESPSPQAAL